MLINYERLGDYVLLAEHNQVFVVAEAHKLKEPTTERACHDFDIAAKVSERYLLPALLCEVARWSCIPCSVSQAMNTKAQ